MKITKDNVKQVIDYIKAGESVFVKVNNGTGSNVWQFSLKDDQRVECRNVDAEYGRYYQLTPLEHDGMWGYELVNESGDPVDMDYYISQSTKHTHYDLIMQWAADPVNNMVQFKNACNDWMDTKEPAWRLDIEYRIKPKEPVIYRQVIYTVISEGPTLHLMSLDKYASFDDFVSDDEINIVGWYDATAEERFE